VFCVKIYFSCFKGTQSKQIILSLATGSAHKDGRRLSNPFFNKPYIFSLYFFICMNTSRLIFLLWASISCSYAQWVEDFSSGSLQQPHRWQGSDVFFKINAAQQLQSDGPAATGTLFLSTSSTALKHTLWQCWLKMDFASSSSNYAKIILAASSSDFMDPELEAYYLKIGGISGNSDGVDLFHQQGDLHTRIIKGVEGRAGNASVLLRLKVLCDEQGNWSVYSDDQGLYNFQLEGRTRHEPSFTPEAFGLMYIHTSTRRDKFYVDDMLIDDDPFLVSSLAATGSQTLIMEFSQGLSMPHSSSNFVLDGKPLSSDDRLEMKGQQLFIHLKNALAQGQHTLLIPPVLAVNGKPLANAGLQSFSYVREVKPSDVFITEIMSDPEPSQGLPNAEYVELRNTTQDTLWVDDFAFGDPATKARLPTFRLVPQARLILCPSAQVDAWRSYGPALGLSPWPSLNNEQDSLFLFNAKGLLLDRVVYDTDRLSVESKKEGGWAMELVHEEEHCKGFLNWAYAEHLLGGTPGAINSVAYYPFDRTGPKALSQVLLSDKKTQQIVFDEPLDTLHKPIIKRYDTEQSITSHRFEGERDVSIFLPIAQGHAVTISCEGLRDCLGNSSNIELELQHPKRAEVGELKINEVLFNPYPYGEDFVEVYNTTALYLSLDSIRVSNEEGEQAVLRPGIMPPYAYRVLTADSMDVKSFYPESAWGTFVKVELPVFADASGNVRVLGTQGQELDHMRYTEDMHHPFLESKEGFSLERVRLDQVSAQPDNWLSASVQQHGATPGYRNSQSGDATTGGELVIEPANISPGTDGYRNYAYIYYTSPKPGASLRADVYSLQGSWVRALQATGPIDVKGMCVWDGTDERGHAVATGLYVLIMEFTSPDGEHYKLKATIGVLSP
jgi:hypothetical protein